MGYRAGEFYRRGYHVLFPDNRGHGKSEGKYVGMGWHDRFDILNWIAWLNEQFPGCSIILYGLSMGGAAVMMTAGEKLPDNVKLIIEDCGYSSVKEEMAHEAKYLFHLPYFPMVSAASLICKIRAGYTFKKLLQSNNWLRQSGQCSLFTVERTPSFLHLCWILFMRPPPVLKRSC